MEEIGSSVPVPAVAHENRPDQVIDAQFMLTHQIAQGARGAQAPVADRGKCGLGHGGCLSLGLFNFKRCHGLTTRARVVR